MIYAGTSGFSYKEWKGPFYPEKLPAKDMLGFYAEKLPAVEINNTFYRLPRKDVLAGWAERVPESFRFAIKASRRITHFKRLKETGEVLGYMLEAVAELGERLGVVLFQMPPSFKADLERLEAFLDELPDDLRAAFEFRNASWFDDEVYNALRARNAALVIADTDEADAEIVATASWGYLRLRKAGYDPEELDAWASAVAAQQWDDAFVFFKHEDAGAGPKMAARFLAGS